MVFEQLFQELGVEVKKGVVLNSEESVLGEGEEEIRIELEESGCGIEAVDA